ncbi:concanavalin A-like lectin/glucanase [Schizopora paradoxa]|uniref:Concanavalin A-like lectin/glucanase n=1 Tax=Schizopora paradoxa TaxID=27342 RepID=A0A0H2S5D9_9AGAM|nr:concanavalin A-like lectin/glucanase [Schizopora paradoxa]
MLIPKYIAPRRKSTALTDEGKRNIEKPWLAKRDMREYISWVLTWSMMLFCAGAAAVMCLLDARNVKMMGDLCLVLHDDFDNGLNRDVWFHEVDMGGFGNKEFEMTTNSDNNTFVEDGILYIVPTLTEDAIGHENVYNGYTYNISGCTNVNLTTCSATSNYTTQKVVNPVQSARISTKFSHSITYGRVEVRARLPRGDWLWPAIWMLPTRNDYGPWPMSGEIDIMESRGNGRDYPFQGDNYVRTSLNWGPADFINYAFMTYGWWKKPRMRFSDNFHTFVLEWSPTFLRSYVDTRLQMPFSIDFNQPFYERGNFPATAFNGSTEIVIENPWKGSGSNSAPFDKPFYLIMNVAVGGTNGWFPDTVGDKPWFDGSENAMYQFAKAQPAWYPSWPEDLKRRGMAIDYVKMWQSC